jgi:hypothetical protein
MAYYDPKEATTIIPGGIWDDGVYNFAGKGRAIHGIMEKSCLARFRGTWWWARTSYTILAFWSTFIVEGTNMSMLSILSLTQCFAGIVMGA